MPEHAQPSAEPTHKSSATPAAPSTGLEQSGQMAVDPGQIQRKLDARILSPANVLALQRSVGNRVVQRLLSQSDKAAQAQKAPLVQPKLMVGPAQDRYEQEADRIADQVMRTPSPKTPLQRQREDEERLGGGQVTDGASIQRKASADSSFNPGAGFERQLRQAKHGGQALPEGLRSHMESHFGANFKEVRIHTGANAIQMSRDIQAQAFTHGSHIFFNDGKYAPETNAGKRLLAHELTHVVQQGGAPVQTKRDKTNNAKNPARVKQSIQRESMAKSIHQMDALPIQRLLLPEAARAFSSAVAVNPDYERAKNLVDKIPRNETVVDPDGSIHEVETWTTTDNVKAEEQSKLIDVGSSSVIRKLFNKNKKNQPPAQENLLVDYMRAYLLADYAKRITNLRTDSRYPTAKEKQERRKFYLKKAVDARNKIKPLIKKGVAAPETQTWLKEHGFGSGINLTEKQKVDELVKAPRIDVRSTFIGGPVMGINIRAHLFIVYTGRDGRQFFFRGGPDHRNYTVADWGEYTEKNTTDYDPSAPSVTVLTGDAAEAKLDALIEATSVINAMKVPYVAQLPTNLFGKLAQKSLVAGGLDALFGTRGENCNATAWTILQRAGIPAKKPAGKHPGWGSMLGSHTPGDMKKTIAPKETMPQPGDGTPYTLSKWREIVDPNGLVQVYHDRSLFQNKTKMAVGTLVEVIQDGRDFRQIRYGNGQLGFIKKNSKERFRNLKEELREWMRKNPLANYMAAHSPNSNWQDFSHIDTPQAYAKVLIEWSRMDNAKAQEITNHILESMITDLHLYDSSFLWDSLDEIAANGKDIFDRIMLGLSDEDLEYIMENDTDEIAEMAKDAGISLDDATTAMTEAYEPLRLVKQVKLAIASRIDITNETRLNEIVNEMPAYTVLDEVSNEVGTDFSRVISIANSMRAPAYRGKYLEHYMNELDEYDIQALSEQQALYDGKLTALSQAIGVSKEFIAHRLRDALPQIIKQRAENDDEQIKLRRRLPVYKYTSDLPPDADNPAELVDFISESDVSEIEDPSDEYYDSGWMSFTLNGTQYWAQIEKFLRFVDEQALDYLERYKNIELMAMSEDLSQSESQLDDMAKHLGLTHKLAVLLTGKLLPKIFESREDEEDSVAEVDDALADLEKWSGKGSHQSKEDDSRTIKIYDSYDDNVVVAEFNLSLARTMITMSEYGRNQAGWVDVVYMRDNARIKTADWLALEGKDAPTEDSSDEEPGLDPDIYKAGRYIIEPKTTMTFMAATDPYESMDNEYTIEPGVQYDNREAVTLLVRDEWTQQFGRGRLWLGAKSLWVNLADFAEICGWLPPEVEDDLDDGSSEAEVEVNDEDVAVENSETEPEYKPGEALTLYVKDLSTPYPPLPDEEKDWGKVYLPKERIGDVDVQFDEGDGWLLISDKGDGYQLYYIKEEEYEAMKNSA
jgi:hypothetical protein